MASRGRLIWLCRAAHGALLLSLGSLSYASVITITDGGDALHDTGCAATGTGVCTLRDAITFANANPLMDYLDLSVSSVRPLSALPAITDPVSLTSTVSAVIDGSLAGQSDGLTFATNVSVMNGVHVWRFQGSGIVVLGDNNVFGLATICFALCSDYSVSADENGGDGFDVRGAGNLLRVVAASGNGRNGFHLHGGAVGNVVGGESFTPPYRGYFGSAAAINNGQSGIQIGDGAADIGIVGNAVAGAYWKGNGGLEIDLGGDCETDNDPGDGDTGPNRLQNYPSVSSSVINGDGTAAVTWTLSGPPGATFLLSLYSKDVGYRQPTTTTVTTDAAGEATFTQTFPSRSSAEDAGITATDAQGNTSELGRMAVGEAHGLKLHTVDPCRLVDTREEQGVLAGRLLDQRPRTYMLLGTCGVSLTARALVLNVTVTNATGSGFVSFPAEAPRCRPFTSTINFAAGQTRANNAIVNLGREGQLQAFPVVSGAGTVDLILDVTGYFE